MKRVKDNQLEPYEIETINFLVSRGYKLSVLPAKNLDHTKTPDIRMLGVDWEIKAPISVKHKTLEHRFDRALRQSPNLVFDLRRIKGSGKPGSVPDVVRRNLEKFFETSLRIRRLIIITKDAQLLSYSKQS